MIYIEKYQNEMYKVWSSQYKTYLIGTMSLNEIKKSFHYDKIIVLQQSPISKNDRFKVGTFARSERSCVRSVARQNRKVNCFLIVLLNRFRALRPRAVLLSVYAKSVPFSKRDVQRREILFLICKRPKVKHCRDLFGMKTAPAKTMPKQIPL